MSGENRAAVRVLSETLANQIAAGEVVERPASVVKELVENALDARASTIKVEALAGGVQLLRIEDNGHGMTEEDASLAVMRHATSKVAKAEDLLQIQSLGFRGEALPSIASVSRFSLTTATKDAEAGCRVSIVGGGEISIEPAPPVKGTTVEVADLFYNTPARRKFLKRNATEIAHISDAITRLALAHPQCAFSFIAEGRSVLDVPALVNADEDARQYRLTKLLGKATADALVPIPDDGIQRSIQVRGYFGAPPLGERGARGQYIFVNGRFVRDKTIQHSLNECYSGRLPKGKHPVAVLFISINPADVDVNVHPQKTELRFVRPGEIFRAVQSHIRRGLAQLPAAPVDPSGPLARRKALILAAERQIVTPEQASLNPPPTEKETPLSPLNPPPTEKETPLSPLNPPPTEKETPLSPLNPPPTEKETPLSPQELKERPPSFDDSSGSENLSEHAPADAGSQKRYQGHSNRLLNAFKAKPIGRWVGTSEASSLSASGTYGQRAAEATQESETPVVADRPSFIKPPHQSSSSQSPSSSSTLPFPAEGLEHARRIGIVLGQFLALELSDALWLVDLAGVAARVAHETSPSLENGVQALLIPKELTIRTAEQRVAAEECLSSLCEHGLDVRLEDDRFLIFAAPIATEGLDLEGVFHRAVDEMKAGVESRAALLKAISEERKSHPEKISVPHSEEEIETLLQNLQQCSIRDHAPDGRALIVALTSAQLRNLFRGQRR